MRPWITVVIAASLAGCMQDSSGTFVGNPSLTAGYSDTETQRASGGSLTTQQVTLRACDEGSDVILDAPRFQFVGNASRDSAQIPAGSYCGVSLVIEELLIRFENEDGAVSSIVGRNFDMSIDAEFVVEDAQRWSMQLGPSDWLNTLAGVSAPGQNVVESEGSDLGLAFFGGLNEGSSIIQVEAVESALNGQLDLDTFTASPRGVPTTATGCAANADIELAVPIPTAAMATKTDAVGIGWCEGVVRFSADLAHQETRQIDYATLGTDQVLYNGWGQGCGSLHCNDLFDADDQISEQACTVLAICEADGTARVTGYAW